MAVSVFPDRLHEEGRLTLRGQHTGWGALKGEHTWNQHSPVCLLVDAVRPATQLPHLSHRDGLCPRTVSKIKSVILTSLLSALPTHPASEG